jgi:hypothetical protein
MSQVLRPGAELSKHADAGAEMAGICRYLQQGLRSCAK